MSEVRVYQLAKELKVQSALILELLDRMGREVKSDLSSLDGETAELVRERLLVAIDQEKKRQAAEKQTEEARRVDERTVAEDEETTDSTVPIAALPTFEVAELSAQETVVATAPASDADPVIAPAVHVAEPKPAVVPDVPRPRVFAARRTTPIHALPRPAPRSAMPPPRAIPGRPSVPPRTDVGRPPMPPPRSAQPPSSPPRVAPGPQRPAPPAAHPRGERRKGKGEVFQLPISTRVKPDLPPVPEKITLSEAVTVKELAEKLNRKSKDVIAKLLARGVLANINQPIEHAMAIEVAKEFGAEALVISFEEEVRQEAPAVSEIASEADSAASLKPRPPVVTVMGHVDHGKTSLLDAIRTTNVVSTEHGGITQHIGAYQVEERGRKITFLDTPGHEAFTLMRARGAKATDIVVLVVAADDGVKPQTLEAIDHAKAANVPIVVAINKVDKPDSRPERVKQQLADNGLLIEEYGGTTVCCQISAKKRTGIEELLEMILLVADLQDLKANPDKVAAGVVLEAKLDRARGIVSTVLVQSGTLRIGDPFIAGTAFGRVRAMADEHGRRVDQALPSAPVEVMGFASEPGAGDLFQAVADEWKARQIASFRQEKVRVANLAKSSKRTLEALSREIAEGQVKELPVLLKADVQGSLEALQKSIAEIPSEKVRILLLRGSTGAITQADVLLAAASGAIIVGFNVRADRATAELARQEAVEIRPYTVIYEVVDQLKQAMVGMLEPTLKEAVLGQAEVRKVFRVPKVGTVAGCYMIDGRATRAAEVRLLRDNVVIYTGKVGSLRRFKDDVSEVKQGFECGIGIANFNDLKESDVIEFFVIEKIAVHTL